MSKCISNHGEYSEHEPGDPCPWCGEYDIDRIIAERDEAEERIKVAQNVLDQAAVDWTTPSVVALRNALKGNR